MTPIQASDSPSVQEIEELGRAGDVARLTELMASDEIRDSRVNRQAVLTALEKEIGDERTIPALQALFSSTHPHLRFDAARQLGKIGGSKAVEALLVGAIDEDESVRARSFQAISEAGPGNAIPTLVEGLKDSSWAVRNRACLGLERARDPETAAVLGASLRDSNRTVRIGAAKALEAIGTRVAAQELADAADEAPFLEARRLRAAVRRVGF
jgi:HEAT repeat protein